MGLSARSLFSEANFRSFLMVLSGVFWWFALGFVCFGVHVTLDFILLSVWSGARIGV